MTEADIKLEDEKLRAEVSKLVAETGQIRVNTLLASFLAAAAVMGATVAVTAAVLNFYS